MADSSRCMKQQQEMPYRRRWTAAFTIWLVVIANHHINIKHSTHTYLLTHYLRTVKHPLTKVPLSLAHRSDTKLARCHLIKCCCRVDIYDKQVKSDRLNTSLKHQYHLSVQQHSSRLLAESRIQYREVVGKSHPLHH